MYTLHELDIHLSKAKNLLVPYPQKVKSLFLRGAFPDWKGVTPLQLAVFSFYAEALLCILSTKFIQIDAKDFWGQTALDWAVKFGNQESFKSHSSINSHAKIQLISIIEKLTKSAVLSLHQYDLEWAASEFKKALDLVKMMQEIK